MQIGPTSSMMPAPPVDPTPASNQDPTLLKQVATAVRALNQSEMYGQDRELQFARDPGTKALVIKVVQQQTGEVLEQIPPEEILRAAAALQQLARGKGK
jgi:flagellar protein FlaG